MTQKKISLAAATLSLLAACTYSPSPVSTPSGTTRAVASSSDITSPPAEIVTPLLPSWKGKRVFFTVRVIPNPEDFRTQALTVPTKLVFDVETTYGSLTSKITFEQPLTKSGIVDFIFSAPIGMLFQGPIKQVGIADGTVYKIVTVDNVLEKEGQVFQLSLTNVKELPAAAQPPVSTAGGDGINFGSTPQSVPLGSITATERPDPTPTPASGGTSSIPADETIQLTTIANTVANILASDKADWVALFKKVADYSQTITLDSTIMFPAFTETSVSTDVLSVVPNRGVSLFYVQVPDSASLQFNNSPLSFMTMMNNVALNTPGKNCIAGYGTGRFKTVGADSFAEVACFTNYTNAGVSAYSFSLIPASALGGVKTNFADLNRSLAAYANTFGVAAFLPVGSEQVGSELNYKALTIQRSTRQSTAASGPLYTPESLGLAVLGEAYTGISQGYKAENTSDISCINGLHPGIDYPAAEGSPVMSPVAGTVVRLNEEDGQLVIQMRNNSAKRLMFLHMEDFNNLREGDEVAVNSIVGHVGHKGFATGNHVHVELRVNTNSASCYFNENASDSRNLDPVTVNR